MRKPAATALLNDMSMKPYRIDDKTAADGSVHLHFEILDGKAAADAVPELVTRLNDHAADLELLRRADATMTLDCGIFVEERELSKSVEFSANLMRLLSALHISLSVSLYKTDSEDVTPS